MRALRHLPCSLLTLGMVLIPLAGALLAPVPALAGCGDHVEVVAPQKKTASTPAPALPAEPEKKHAPCSGPHCTRPPLAPTPAPAVPVGSVVPDAACLVRALFLPANHSTPILREDSREHLYLYALGIYHPPRWFQILF